jgi:hypothetical protein
MNEMKKQSTAASVALMLLVFFFVLVLYLVLATKPAKAQSGTSAMYQPMLVGVTTTGRTLYPVNVRNAGIVNHVFQWTVTGGPATCTLLIESSPDGVTWATAATQSCTSSGTLALPDASYIALGVNLSALTGGSSPTVSVNYRGYLAGQGYPVRVSEGGTGTVTQFTLGSMIFAGTNGAYTQDNTNFFWDNTSKRLGILTAAPTTALEIGAQKFRVTAAGGETVAGGSTILHTTSADVPLTVQGKASQSANLQEWKNSAGVVVASVGPSGALTSGSAQTGRSRFSTVPVGSVGYASFGTNTTLVAGTTYYAEVTVARDVTLTGVGVLNGATVGTNSWVVGLHTSAGGADVAHSALAGTLSSGANSFQQIAFTSTYAASGPARYWIAFQSNGTTDTARTVAVSTFIDVFTKSVAGSFGTLPSLTVPTTFTADVGPIAYVY